ncbi:unnamed protein product [Adineta ricciae]|uniref:t-SNARE coiled-coil homology domain-containing protein n=1 Tax=Adineta ricciae TaxID=249248 RepID=A0A813NI34_ADIRI|nr:unnamed protein product [Adineta ricciae]CAF0775684.1 unnamed protein product [Adineta ricciae]
MVKDRLEELKNRVRRSDEGQSVSLMHYYSIINAAEPFMDDFFISLNATRSHIQQISELVEQVGQLQNILLTSDVTPGIKQELEKTMTEIKQSGNDIRMKLKHMKEVQEMDSTCKRRNVRQRIMDGQIDACIKYFCAIMGRYYELVVTYRKQCKTRLVRQLEIANISRTDEEVEEILAKGHATLFPEVIIELQDARQNLVDMKARHENLNTLENDIEQLRDMFLDLTYLIYFQTEQVHSIEEAVLNAELDIEPFSRSLYPKQKTDVSSLKFSRKKYLSSIVKVFSKLFATCLCSSRLACS